MAYNVYKVKNYFYNRSGKQFLIAAVQNMGGGKKCACLFLKVMLLCSS